MLKLGRLPLAGVALALLMAPALAQSTPSAQGSWAMKTPMPTARNEVQLATVGGKVYVLGGSVGGVAGPQADQYDPATDSWRALAPMPKGLDHLGAAVIGSTITTVGGFIGSVHRGAVSNVYQYDVTSNTWKTLAPMKAPRASVGVALLDGKIHAVGGRGVDNTFTVATHEVF